MPIAPVFCCGFECGVTSSSLHIASTQGSYSTSTVRSGARSHRFNPTAVSTGHIATTITLTASDKWIIRCYINFATLPSADCLLLYVTDGTIKVGLGFKQSTSKIDVGNETAGGTSIFSGGVSVTTGVWYRVELYVNSSANPWTYDGKVDGVQLSNPATQVRAAATPTNFVFGVNLRTGSITADVFFDDFLASNTIVDYPLGAGYVNHFVPTSDGTHNVAGANDFERSATGTDIINSTTTAFQLIDDVPLKSGVVSEYINLIAPPNATDYVEVVLGPAPGISTPTNAPRAVEAIVAHASSAAGTHNLRIALNDNGSLDDVLNTTTAPGTTAAYARKFYSDPPSAASVWTLSGNGNFNNVRMRCFTSDAAPDPWWASAMIEAEFQEIAAIPNKIVNINQSVKRAAYY